MEEFSFRKKIRKTVGIVGFSALSMLPSDKSKELPKDNDLQNKNKVELKNEYTRNELELNKNIDQKIALELIKEDMEDYCGHLQRGIKFADESIKELYHELEKRKKTSKIDQYYEMSDKDIINQIEDLKNFKLNYEQKLKIKKNPFIHNEEKELYLKNVKESVKEIKNLIDLYDKGRQWVLNNIKNSEYKKRFEEEEKQSSDIPRDQLEDYVRTVYKERIEAASDRDFVLSKDINKSASDSTTNTAAFYSLKNDKTYFPLQSSDSLETIMLAIHEYEHKVNKGGIFLSLKSVELFSKSFDTLSVVTNIIGLNNKDSIKDLIYYSDPTEIYSRKKSFDYDLERLGIKKYEEKFTLQHYLKALELKKEGQLNSDSKNFLYIIKPEMIIKVMNEVADVGNDKKEERNSV